MEPTQRKLLMLEQMGVGPAWGRRASAAAGVPAPEAASAPEAAPVSASVSAPATAPAAITPAAVAVSGFAEPVPVLPGDSGVSMVAAHAPAVADDIATFGWDELHDAIAQCTRCRLCEGRHLAVPGTGDRKARWLFVGEGPGHEEDKQGEPFIGNAGKLLDSMLRAMGLERGKDTYIANIVKCRPVGADGGDRPPAADEISACRPYLERQLALIQPDIIIALGKTAALSLLGLGGDVALSAVRGKPGDWQGIPVVPTYHPAYLLRRPADKAKARSDLCLAMRIANGDS